MGIAWGGERRPDEEGIETPQPTPSDPDCRANADLMKKGLRRTLCGLVRQDHWANADLMKKGLRLVMTVGELYFKQGERRPDEEGIET